MTLFPRSLLWRTVLLLALLMVAGNLAWLQIFRASEREPRALQIAQQITSVVNLTRSALITGNPVKRLDLLRDLSQQEGIQVYAGEPNEPVAALPDRPGVRLITIELQRRLGDDTKLLGASDGTRAVWVSFKIDDEEYWVRLPRERIERQEQLRWIGWGVLVLALSVVGAFLIVARINRPLRELTRAAAVIGRGRTPSPVTESGPSEIRTLARAFNQMASDLKRIDENRALLLAGVSHDLRTPLSRIRLGVEMLDDKAETALKEGMVQDIADIDAVINQFLDFARVTGEESVASEFDLNELVNSVIERYRRQSRTITTRLGTVPRLQMKALAIQRLLTNLVDNALRHGGPEVEIETATEGAHVRLSVLDRGPGIPQVETERMLQPFTRLNEARSTSGSGLGLAIVDRIARLHHGSVSLLARNGGGLEARVEFPIATAKS
ncbi:MAG: HAMP domain-containing protein [Betaproteobacteria bacterium]|nr:HAMP domain-containing protein [Betaproteobacteria bacterium]